MHYTRILDELNYDQIRPPTTEITALEPLKKQQKFELTLFSTGAIEESSREDYLVNLDCQDENSNIQNENENNTKRVLVITLVCVSGVNFNAIFK